MTKEIPEGTYRSTTCESVFRLSKNKDGYMMEYIESHTRLGKKTLVTHDHARRMIGYEYWIKKE